MTIRNLYLGIGAGLLTAVTGFAVVVALRDGQPSERLDGSGLVASQDSAGRLQDDATTTSVSASWAFGYGDIATMAADSRVIVRGQPTAVLAERRGELIFSTYTFNVEESAKGSLETGTEIRLLQTGGTLGDESMVVSDDPLLDVHQEYVLFLQYSAEEDLYFIAGGPMGRFVVNEGMARTLSGWYPDRNISSIAGADGMTVDELLEEARSHANDAPPVFRTSP